MSRSVKQSVNEAAAFISKITKFDVGILGILYWATYNNEQEAIYGWFKNRSPGYIYPNFKLHEQNKCYNFSSETVRIRANFAIEAISNSEYTGNDLRQVRVFDKYFDSNRFEIPDGDRAWKRDVISASKAGRNFPSHPNKEIDFLIKVMYRQIDFDSSSVIAHLG